MKSYIEKMQCFLSNQTILYMKFHNLHWFIHGSSFFTLHAEFEKLYDTSAEVIDEVAERLLMLGKAPISSLKSALSAASIEERDAQPVNAVESVKIVLADLQVLEADAKEIISLAQDEKDDVTADIFTGYLTGYQKTIWMMNTYLK